MQTGHLNQARKFAERGNYRQARTAYKKALAATPRDADILMELAVLEAQNSHWKSARGLLEKAEKITPNDVAVHLNLGEVCLQAALPDAAVTHYRKALELSPNDVDALYGLGDILRTMSNSQEAVPLLERAHKLAPADTEILNALAIALEADGQVGRAMQSYHQAITLAPDNTDAWCNYGQLLFSERRFADAAQCFEGAQKRLSDALPTGLLLNWAISLAYAGHYDRAFEVIERAVQAGDQAADTLFTKGTIYMQYGDFDTARRHFEETIQIDENAGEAFEKLARIKHLDLAASDRLKTILDDQDLAISPRVGAGFALYSIFDKAGQYDDAFTALAQANALKAQSLKFSKTDHETMMSRSISVFDKAFFEAHQGQGLDTNSPIFILGMPRSGTTLSEQILASYPEVKACGEQQDFQRLVAALPDYPEHLDDLPSSWARQQGERILEAMIGDAPDARFATNKSPGNYAFIGLITWLFPNARIIYCKRDPRDIGLSSFEQNFRAGLSFTYDLAAFGFAYRQHERIMQHWKDTAPVDIHVVEYERLVSEPDTVARDMVEFCGLRWTPECLDMARVNRPIETASVWQVRQPINKGSIGKWKRYERHLEPMLKALGME